MVVLCVCVCVCMSVGYQASCYVPCLRVQSAMLYSTLWPFKRMTCVDFAETLCSSVSASFADSKLLDFSQLAVAYK